jgi:WD40 repeat protein
VLLAIEASQIANPPFEAVKALHEALRQDRTIRTITWPSDRELHGGVSGALSPDGRMVVLNGNRGHLEAYDVDEGMLAWSVDITGGEGLRIPADEGVVTSGPHFTLDGSMVLAVADWSSAKHPDAPADSKLGIYGWDSATGKQVLFIASRSCPRPAEISQNGQFIDIHRRVTILSGTHFNGFVGAVQGTGRCDQVATRVSLLDLESERMEKVLDLAPDDSPWVSISADERYLARAQPGSISVVDLRNRKTVFRMRRGNHGDPVLNADGSRFLISGAGGLPVELWDVASGQKLRDFPHQQPCCVWFNQDETMLYTAGLDNSVQVWEVETGLKISNLKGSGLIFDAHTSADDNRLATVAVASRVLSLQPIGEVATWDLGRTGFNPASSLHLAGSRGSAYIYDERTGQASAVVFDRSTGRVERTVKNLAGQLIRLSPDGTRLAAQQAVGRKVGTVVVQDLATGNSVEMDGLCLLDSNGDNPQCQDPPSTPFAHEVWDLAFSSDGSLLASGGWSGTLAVWNSTTGELLWSRGHLGPAWVTIAFSPDSRWLVAAPEDSSLIVFDPRTGKEVKRVSVPFASCGRLRFTPDARHLLCGTEDGLVLVLDAASWKVLRVLKAHQGAVVDMEVSPNGKVIASSGTDGFVRTWDLGSGAALQAFSLGEGRAQDVEFLDERHLAVRGKSGPVLIYTLDTDELLKIARGRVTRAFSETECQTYHIDPCPDLAAIQGH